MVILALVALHISASSKTVHQFYRTVVPDLQPFGQFSDARTSHWGQALEGQHQLVLAGFEAMSTSSQLAEVKKTTDVIPQIGQDLVVALR